MPISIIRQQVYDHRKKEYIDEVLPTLTVKRGTKIRSTAARVKIGSHIVGPGSTFQMFFLRICAGSYPADYEIIALGSPFPGEIKGTVDVGRIVVNIYGSISPYVFPPLVTKDNPKYFGQGTLEVYATPGSPDYVYCAFEGLEF